MKRERDPFLDRLRTLAIVWVLMVHLFYWLNFFPTGTLALVKSWLLLEMPLFFFITGAGQSLSKPRPWGEYVLGSYRRMLIPYWCYALLCLLINGLLGGSGEALEGFHIGSLTGSDILRWLLPLNRKRTELPFLADALWYVPIYLLCVPLIPLLRRGMKRPWPLVSLLFVLLLAFERQGWYYPQNVAFYCFWIFAGLHYPAWKARYIDKTSRRWELLLIACIGVAVVAAACIFGNAAMDMQENKFPPKGIFLLFSVTAMSVLTLLLPGIVRIMNLLGRIKLLNWGMEQLSQYSLSVFLYQPLAFLLLHRLMMLWERLGLRHSVQFVCCCVLIVPMAVILAALFGPLERLGKRRKA